MSDEYPSAGGTDKDSRMWAMICHLACLIAFIGVPLGNILGPLIIWLIKKDDSPFIDEHGKESLNFQITLFVYMIIPAVFSFVLIGIPFLLALLVFGLVCMIKAATAANRGESYRYPYIFRLIN